MDQIPTQEDLDRIADALAPIHLDWVSVIVAIAVFVASVVVARLARQAVRRFAARLEGGSATALAAVARVVAYLIVVLGAAAALSVLGIDLLPLLGGLGIVAVVLAFALRPFLENLAAGLTLQVQRPIAPSDDVLLSGIEGRVREITARTVVLQTRDGKTAHIPNRRVLDDSIVNYSTIGRRRTDLDVGLAYGTDLAAAADILVAAAAATPGVLAEPAPQALVHVFADSTINAAVRYWHDPSIDATWLLRHDVALGVKRALDAAGIEIAFPQRVLWYADASG